jgi:arsenate reductase (glutaredoxin)
MTVRIYHNPRCSKSRATLALLRGQGHEPEVVEYLSATPSVDELDRVCAMLGKEPLEIMRTKEARFGELGLSKQDERGRAEWIAIMADNPILIERPIVINRNRAAIGRPPEAVLAIL